MEKQFELLKKNLKEAQDWQRRTIDKLQEIINNLKDDESIEEEQKVGLDRTGDY